jgi:hypothetical protein
MLAASLNLLMWSHLGLKTLKPNLELRLLMVLLMLVLM